MATDTIVSLSEKRDWIDRVDALLKLAETAVGETGSLDVSLAARIALYVEIISVRKRLSRARIALSESEVSRS